MIINQITPVSLWFGLLEWHGFDSERLHGRHHGGHRIRILVAVLVPLVALEVVDGSQGLGVQIVVAVVLGRHPFRDFGLLLAELVGLGCFVREVGGFRGHESGLEGRERFGFGSHGGVF